MCNKIEAFKLKENLNEFYNIVNKKCPVCEHEISELTSIVKLGNIGYHTECYFKTMDKILNR